MEDQQNTPTERSVSDSTTGDGRLEATGVYETAGDVVLYDTENPLAWVESDTAVELSEMV
jgi:hypothetical protein